MTPKKVPKKVKRAAPPAKTASKPVAKTKTEPAAAVTEPAPVKSRKPWYIALFASGLLVLAVATYFALPGDMPGFEQSVFSAVNGVSAPDWVSAQVAKPISNAVWGMIALVGVLLLVPKFRMRAWRYAAAAGSTYIAVYILEHLIERGRPADLPYDVVLRAAQSGYGFPSGHVAVLTALVLTAWPFVAWPWRIVLAVLVIAEAWSRVFLGVHAPLDVIAGAAVGGAAVGAIHLLPGKVRSFFKLGTN
jgi:membrane-associated phospholipid phosphatase